MKMHQFVSGSAVILAGWLMVTFFHDLSPQQYPPQRRGGAAHAAAREALKPGDVPHQANAGNAAELAAASTR